MGDVSLTVLLVTLVSSLGTAVLALWAFSTLTPRRVSLIDRGLPPEEQIVFMFEGRDLCDATPAARQLLETGLPAFDQWDRLIALLHRDFPDFSKRIDSFAEIGELTLHSTTGSSRLEVNWYDGMARIGLIDGTITKSSDNQDGRSFDALNAERKILQDTIDEAPLIAWHEDSNGDVRWANGGYLALAQKLTESQDPPRWPLPRVFTSPERLTLPDTAKGTMRLSCVPHGTDDAVWYECRATRNGDMIHYYGVSASELVQAEFALRDFVQTLSKTFADLPIGLAVFDKNRQLALFNPALIDLTNLEPMFLSTRPTLHAFLDQLREKQRMPEPKNYKSWRQGIAELEAAAASDSYQEDWTLPTGQTYRVTGQPHPNGAVAFLFEDISAEISLTRRFRSELELGQSVVDSLPEALAVFSASGILTLTNKAYGRLWGSNPDETIGEINIIDTTRQWQSMCLPSPIWGEARDFIEGHVDRVDWSGEVELLNGQRLICRFAPLSRNTTLIAFSKAEDVVIESSISALITETAETS